MIGSETFIIVALRCTENSTPSSLARAICAVEERVAARRRCMTVASTTSPASTGTDSCSTVTAAVVGDELDAQGAVAADDHDDCSVERKSSAAMWATLVLESGVQAPMECGWVWA